MKLSVDIAESDEWNNVYNCKILIKGSNKKNKKKNGCQK